MKVRPLINALLWICFALSCVWMYVEFGLSSVCSALTSLIAALVTLEGSKGIKAADLVGTWLQEGSADEIIYRSLAVYSQDGQCSEEVNLNAGGSVVTMRIAGTYEFSGTTIHRAVTSVTLVRGELPWDQRAKVVKGLQQGGTAEVVALRNGRLTLKTDTGTIRAYTRVS